jgi:hypothetical protein
MRPISGLLLLACLALCVGQGLTFIPSHNHLYETVDNDKLAIRECDGARAHTVGADNVRVGPGWRAVYGPLLRKSSEPVHFEFNVERLELPPQQAFLLVGLGYYGKRAYPKISN